MSICVGFQNGGTYIPLLRNKQKSVFFNTVEHTICSTISSPMFHCDMRFFWRLTKPGNGLAAWNRLQPLLVGSSKGDQLHQKEDSKILGFFHKGSQQNHFFWAMSQKLKPSNSKPKRVYCILFNCRKFPAKFSQLSTPLLVQQKHISKKSIRQGKATAKKLFRAIACPCFLPSNHSPFQGNL